MKEHPLKAFRRAGVPLGAFETADPGATVRGCVAALNGKSDDVPVVSWDIVNGLVGLNKKGEQAIAWYDPAAMQLPDILKELAERAPRGLVCFAHQIGRFFERDGVCQGLWNLRDAWKAKGATMVLLGPSFKLPGELVQDVVVVNEPLPDTEGIGGIVDTIIGNARAAGAAVATDYPRPLVVDTLLGLSAFAAEQALAMSVGKAGIDLQGLWERKRRLVEQTPGLSVWRGGESFADIGGCENVKGYLAAVLRGRNAPKAIAYVDEIEKSVAGASGDLSGVSQDYLATLLTYMQDKESTGMIFVGPPGAAKSAMAKAAGNLVNIPTIALDLGAMKGSLVGQSEQQLRGALAVIDAVSQQRTLFIATCNSLAVLPPELKRRFTLGTFFFDLPGKEERAAIWAIYRRKFELDTKEELPADDGWTGAEIRQCCSIAWRLNSTLDRASKFIVPVARSASDKIEALRKAADGKFISANSEGFYQYAKQSEGIGTRVMKF